MISPNVTQIGKLNQPEKMKKIETDIEIYAEKIRKPTTLPSFKAYKLDLVEKHFVTTCKSEKFLLNFEKCNLIYIFLQSTPLIDI